MFSTLTVFHHYPRVNSISPIVIKADTCPDFWDA